MIASSIIFSVWCTFDGATEEIPATDPLRYKCYSWDDNRSRKAIKLNAQDLRHLAVVLTSTTETQVKSNDIKDCNPSSVHRFVCCNFTLTRVVEKRIKILKLKQNLKE